MPLIEQQFRKRKNNWEKIELIYGNELASIEKAKTNILSTLKYGIIKNDYTLL